MNISHKTNSSAAKGNSHAGSPMNFIIHTHHYNHEDSESEYEEALEEGDDDDDLLERELRGFQRRQRRGAGAKSGMIDGSAKKNSSKDKAEAQFPLPSRRQAERRTRRTVRKSSNARPVKTAMRTYYHTSESEGESSDDGTTFSRDTPKRRGKKMSDQSSRINQTSPQTCLEEILCGATSKSNLESKTWESYFQGVTEERVAVYSAKAATAVRGNNLTRLKDLYDQQSSNKICLLEGCSPHGETLLHIACRMGHLEIVQYILEEASISSTHSLLRVQDATGRTPLHEACWNNRSNYELILLLLQVSPELLFVQDQRGFTALHYVPKTSWDTWDGFLRRHAAMIRLKVNHSGYQKSKDILNAAQHKMQALLVQRQR